MIHDDGRIAALATAFAACKGVRAVALGGSQVRDLADARSDIDLYVYTDQPVPLALRASLAASLTGRREIDNRFFETGDEWEDAQTGRCIDVMFRDPAWIEGELAATFDRHEARIGYSTCLCFNVASATPLFDRTGWFDQLQASARQPYPDRVARAIVARNQPLLRSNLSSFQSQLVVAAGRGDLVAINHRAAAFLASYFDVLFALNRALHPGEKRMVAYAERLAICPDAVGVSTASLVAAVGGGQPDQLRATTDALCVGLDRCLMRARLDLAS